MTPSLQVLVLDIETAPIQAYTWGLWQQNIGLNQIIDPGRVLCFAAKFLGERKVRFHSEHADGREDMIARAWELLDEADVVVHYNGESFDIPWLNREFLQHGLRPPAPFAQVDLLKAVRKRFRNPSNKLEYVAGAVGIGAKVKHEGFDLWKKCMAGDPKAWKRMEKYNRQDVLLTEELYLRLLPWLPSHPNRHLYGGGTGCPTCGGEHLQRRGFAHTKVSVYQRYQCNNCGSYFRAAKREYGAAVTGVTS